MIPVIRRTITEIKNHYNRFVIAVINSEQSEE